MSAYVVHEAHIDYLVAAGLHYGRDTGIYCGGRRVGLGFHANATDVGRELLAENIASVAYRYEGTPVADLPGPRPMPCPASYRYRLTGRTMEPAQVLCAIDGYVYQACEHPGWATSNAKRFCDDLTRAVIRALPGYAEADWEITNRLAS